MSAEQDRQDIFHVSEETAHQLMLGVPCVLPSLDGFGVSFTGGGAGSEDTGGLRVKASGQSLGTGDTQSAPETPHSPDTRG